MSVLVTSTSSPKDQM